jgi:hypothetical protein
VQEEIFRNDPLVSDRDFKESATIGVEFGNLKGTGQRRWMIAFEEDVARAAGETVAECELYLLPLI